jgi:hypothetical protein
MRTTIDLDPEVLRRLKQRGREQGKTLGQVASELLARALADENAQLVSHELHWPVQSMGRPRVDIDDKDALHRLLDADLDV